MGNSNSTDDKENKIPTWVWIVGGVMALVIIILIVFAIMQMNKAKKCQVTLAQTARAIAPAGVSMVVPTPVVTVK